MQKRCNFVKFCVPLCVCTIWFSSTVYATEMEELQLPDLKVEEVVEINEQEKITAQITPETNNNEELVVSDYMEERNVEIELLKKQYPNLAIINATNENPLNIYVDMDSNGAKVGTTNGKTPCVIINNENDEWCKIRTQNIVGYIQKSNLLLQEEPYIALYSNDLVVDHSYVIVNVNQTNTKTTPNGDNYQKVKRNQKFLITKEVDNWYQIDLGDNNLAYIKDEEVYVEHGILSIANENSSYTYAKQIYQVKNSWTSNDFEYIEFTQEEIERERQALVDFALKFKGNRYVWGGTSLTKGADCSGFVQSIYKNFDISLPRVASDQSRVGLEIQEDDLQPGDLVFYPRDQYPIGHVAIYIGDDEIVHALNTNRGIVVTKMHYNEPVKFMRILG